MWVLLLSGDNNGSMNTLTRAILGRVLSSSHALVVICCSPRVYPTWQVYHKSIAPHYIPMLHITLSSPDASVQCEHDAHFTDFINSKKSKLTHPLLVFDLIGRSSAFGLSSTHSTFQLLKAWADNCDMPLHNDMPLHFDTANRACSEDAAVIVEGLRLRAKQFKRAQQANLSLVVKGSSLYSCKPRVLSPLKTPSSVVIERNDRPPRSPILTRIRLARLDHTAEERIGAGGLLKNDASTPLPYPTHHHARFFEPAAAPPVDFSQLRKLDAIKNNERRIASNIFLSNFT